MTVLEGVRPDAPKWRMDGTDTCHSDAPSLQIAKQILEKRDAYLLVLTQSNEWQAKVKPILRDRIFINVMKFGLQTPKERGSAILKYVPKEKDDVHKLAADSILLALDQIRCLRVSYYMSPPS